MQKYNKTPYMINEIHEQPSVFTRAIHSISENSELISQLKNAQSIVVIACGSSANSSQYFAYLMELICRIPTRVVLASEYKYYPTPNSDFVIAVSQSGETTDTISALKIAKKKRVKTICLTNVLDSSLTQITDSVLYTHAGPEMSIPATKSFTAQIAAFIQIVNIISGNKLSSAIAEIQHHLPIVLSTDVSAAVDICKNASNIMYISRGIGYPIVIEGALKMKETTYIHAEGYTAGEIKHGTFSLLSGDTPVIAICLSGITYSEMLQDLKEVKSLAPLIIIGEINDRSIEDIADIFIPIPKVSEVAGTILSLIIMQLLAYHVAVSLGRDVDNPRNLMKIVNT